MDFDIICTSFERWFHGYYLNNYDIAIIICGIIVCIMLITIVALLVYISIHTFFWHCLGRTLKKIWHWFMRITMPDIYERQEHLSDEEIHDLMNLIYDGNPLKYITIVEPNPLYIRVIGAWTLLCQKGGIC